MKELLLLALYLITASISEAQYSRHIIILKDKGSNPYSFSDPGQYLSPRAIQRRVRYNIPIDSTDLPVTPRYIDSIRLSGNVTILNVSRWLNQVAIQTTDAAALNKINSFPFVLSTGPVAARNFTTIKPWPAPSEENAPVYSGRPGDYYEYGSSAAQVRLNNTDFLHNHGFRGENMHMALLDAGFFHYLTLPTFDSIRINNQVLGTWDFVSGNASVDEDHSHGMQCLSTIAANLPGVFVGTAPKASFYLFRTEDVSTEYPIEEQNWAVGAEKADSSGADMISSSLGYSRFDDPVFDYTYSQMNGDVTISARAADMAARKGMLVCISAGNEGNNTWHYITTPSDADSILTVGATDTLGNPAGFSSFGPSSDGQVKPTISAVGWNAVVAASFTGQPSYNSGTSFSCPIMAGVTACLWQAFPEIRNMDLIDALKISATKASNPDDKIGYGIPDVKKAFVYLTRQTYQKQTASIHSCDMSLDFSVKSDHSMSFVLERRLPGEAGFTSLGNINGEGGFSIKDYTFSDDLSGREAGMIGYRLIMIIGTDTSFVLDSMQLELEHTCLLTQDVITITQPYPSLQSVNIVSGTVNPARIRTVVINSVGQRVYSSAFNQPAGIRETDISLTHLARGVYFVSVYIDNRKAITRQIIRQ